MYQGDEHEDAASIRAGADTAWKALFTEGELEAGQTVLIHAAAGGVGQSPFSWPSGKVPQ
jgi:NADPH:quinone reductase-like Zn-dependent oxidoreductase